MMSIMKRSEGNGSGTSPGCFIIGSVLTIIVSLLYITKDEWLKYFEELYLSFNPETVQLEAGEPFSQPPTSVLMIPKQ